MDDSTKAIALLTHPDASLACFTKPPVSREFFEASLNTWTLFYVHHGSNEQPDIGNVRWTLKCTGWQHVMHVPDLQQRSVSCKQARVDGFTLTGAHSLTLIMLTSPGDILTGKAYRLRSHDSRQLYCLRCVRSATAMTPAERKVKSRKRAREDPTLFAKMQENNDKWLSEHRQRKQEEREAQKERNAFLEIVDQHDHEEAHRMAMEAVADGDVST